MKKWQKRFLGGALAALMSVSCVAFSMTAFAAACPECDGQYNKLYGEPPATTKENGAYLWECDNCGYRDVSGTIYKIDSVGFAQKNYAYSGAQKKPAVIVKDSKGKVISADNYEVTYGTNKVIGTGSATVVFDGCYYDDTVKATFKIIPAKMAAPTVHNAAKGFKITWKKAGGGVTGYEIWRKKGSGDFLKVATIKNADTTSYTNDTDAANANGVKYQYKIRAYKQGHSYGAFSPVTTSYKVARPAAPTVTNSGAGKITVTWKKNDKANGYIIKYVTGTTEKKAYASGAATVSKTLTVNRKAKYTVSVQAYKTVNDKSYHSCFSPAKTITTT